MCVSSVSQFSAALPDPNDVVDVTHMQLKVMLCCSDAQDCEPCLQIIITVKGKLVRNHQEVKFSSSVCWFVGKISQKLLDCVVFSSSCIFMQDCVFKFEGRSCWFHSNPSSIRWWSELNALPLNLTTHANTKHWTTGRFITLLGPLETFAVSFKISRPIETQVSLPAPSCWVCLLYFFYSPLREDMNLV